jgi:hypothetical protein
MSRSGLNSFEYVPAFLSNVVCVFVVGKVKVHIDQSRQ